MYVDYTIHNVLQWPR